MLCFAISRYRTSRTTCNATSVDIQDRNNLNRNGTIFSAIVVLHGERRVSVVIENNEPATEPTSVVSSERLQKELQQFEIANVPK